MNRNRLSPITLKKQSRPKSKKHNEVSINQQIELLEQKIQTIRFSQDSYHQIQQLWNTLHGLKQAEEAMKYINQILSEVGQYVQLNHHDKTAKSTKSNEGLQYSSANRILANLLAESESVKKEAENLQNSISHQHTISEMQKARMGLQLKQKISERLKDFESWLHQSICQAKAFTTSEAMENRVVKNSGGWSGNKKVQVRKGLYEKVVGMVQCRRKWLDDSELKEFVKQSWDKSVQKGRKRKENLIEAEKHESLKKMNERMKESNREISDKFTNLRNFIKNAPNSQMQFHIQFQRVQHLIWQIEGSIHHYQRELQKIEQTLYLSRPKTPLIQYRDPQLAETTHFFSDSKQKWQEIIRLLQFQYCL